MSGRIPPNPPFVTVYAFLTENPYKTKRLNGYIPPKQLTSSENTLTNSIIVSLSLIKTITTTLNRENVLVRNTKRKDRGAESHTASNSGSEVQS